MTSSSTPSRKALSKIASGRLQKELAEWQVGPPAGFSYRVSDNLQRFYKAVSIQGCCLCMTGGWKNNKWKLNSSLWNQKFNPRVVLDVAVLAVDCYLCLKIWNVK
ncbi:uncharacterized protein LOC124651847 [Lolium rigidum]|uniref:uncharacterized protein LOC124651847 n=1 Tax=Lolium rigidum TaxID=89674 RepID=UPI001F5C2E6E|nr:uncharacterized protein LOC124651847 [Lolium rigidum]